ncbi:MAG: MATE family efflux transporter [Bacteroidetes bacterium]|nr:MATE family efflux transporter [Bacteroidota bacterium]
MGFIPKREYSNRILKIAIPAIAGMSIQMIVSIVETAMVGRLHNAAISLAAMGLGVLATWVLTSFFSSLATGTHILVARRYGEHNYKEAGVVLNNSLVLSVLVGIIIALLGYYYAHEFIRFFSADDTVSREAAEYIKYRSLGIPFFLLAVSYRGFFYGIGQTKIFMFSAFITYFFNILFDYFFIYGIALFPAMGLAGAGVGASLGMFMGFLFFVGVTFLQEYRKKYRYYNVFNIHWKYLQQIVRISLPVSFQNVLILLGFLLFVAIAGVLGTLSQAATQVVITSLFVSFMPCFGFGVATQTLVGNALGNNKVHEARIYTIETAKLTTLYTFALGLIYVLFPDIVLSVITTDEKVIQHAHTILQLAGIAQILYGSGIIFANALQAAGATFYVMNIEILSHWILFLPLAYFLGVQYDIVGAWMSLPIYIIVYTVLGYIKFRSNSWTSLKV